MVDLYRWFRATDVAKVDETPLRASKATGKVPQVWQPFTDTDSSILENLYNNLTDESSKEDCCFLPYEFDGLYEANVKNLEYYPIFWSGATYEIRRGLWFDSNYKPITSDLAEQLEDSYKKYRQLVDAAADESVAQYVSENESRFPLKNESEGSFVYYESNSIAWVQTNAFKHKIQRALSMNTGTKYIRGWDVAQFLKDKKPLPDPSTPIDLERELPKPATHRKVDHLIFAIHGIGQKMDIGTTLAEDCDIFRKCISDSAIALKTKMESMNHAMKDVIPDGSGVQVLPIQWRSQVSFSVGVTDHVVHDDEHEEEIAYADLLPDGIPAIRTIIRDVAADIPLYMTERFRNIVLTNVTRDINEAYRNYKKHHPDFDGKVSLLGHSLGSVIAFDVCSHLEDIPNEDVVGSPTSMFLLLAEACLRPVLSKVPVQQPILLKKVARPSTKALYNIYHPNDPVAHRLEPMFSQRLTSLKPVPIAYNKGGLTNTLKEIESAKAKTQDYISKFMPRFGEFAKDQIDKGSTEVPKAVTKDANELQKDAIDRLKLLNPHGRLDFALQEFLMENPYISSMVVHFGYWGDLDVASFVLKAVYGIYDLQ
ncbi:hypothetical protein HDV02_003859 [Globomyces sp. JEL0801]|nr:hypothetical protein HDV02_003859 [Globomyces sp. JEL0801]